MPNKVILIVDDEAHNIDVLFDDLSQAGFKILVAENGETALKRISHIKPDIILMDVKMPGINGFETCERLKSQKDTKNIPIIFMTAVADTTEKLKGFELGAIDYIIKPFQATEVVARVETHLTISHLEKKLKAQNTQLQGEIIERERIEEALRTSEMKNRLLLQHVPDLIITVEREGQVTYINHPVEGFVSDTLIGKKFINLLSDKYQVRYSKALSCVFEEKQADSFEYKNAQDQYFLAHVIPVERDDNIVSAMMISTDITDRRKNAELKQAVRLKDEFLANMSHELRTPLSAVLMMSEILREDAYGKLNQKQLKTVDNIETSARHLLSLINDILDLSKITAGQMEIQLQTINVTAVCQASLQFIREIANKKNIKILFVDDDTINTMMLDECRFKQILVNLLNNSVKFTPKNGKVILEIESDQPHKIVHFNVVDTGIGIPEDQMKHLFEPFVQIDGSLSRPHEGTGLGLSLVEKLTKLHNGTIQVKSTPGKGSQFTVSIPLNIGKEHAL